MATWKKVIVSGSDISQLNNDAGYLTAGTALNAFSTASFNGTDLLANSSNGVLNFASSSDQGLTISADAGSDTLTFGLNAIPNTSLANSSITVGTTVINLGDTPSTIDGLTLTDTEATGSFTGSFVGKFVGTTDLPDLIDGNGIVDFTYDGSSTATIAVQADSTTGGNTVPVSVSANGVGLDVDSIDGTGLSANGSGLLNVDYGSTAGTAVEGDTTITLNGTTNAIDITGTAAQALGGAPVYTVDLSNTIDGDRTFTNDIIISGDLTVQGTASFQETENLRIADRFALFASGSTTTGDGGIVIQQTTADTGELFGYDSATERWAVTSSFDASTSAFTPDAFMAVAFAGAGDDPTAIDSRYQAKGNIFVANNEDIFIYS